MLNLGKERFIGNIVLKRSFQMALMSVKNLVYNKLARQNIFCFINSISVLVVLTNCYNYSDSCFYHYLLFFFFLFFLILFFLGGAPTSMCHFFGLSVCPHIVHHFSGTVHHLIIIFGTHI